MNRWRQMIEKAIALCAVAAAGPALPWWGDLRGDVDGGRFEDALDRLRVTSAVGLAGAGAWLKLASLLYARGNAAEAWLAVEEAAARLAPEPRVLAAAAFLRFESGQIDEAEDAAARASALAPAAPEPHLAAALLCARRGDAAHAREHCAAARRGGAPHALVQRFARRCA
jgi:tetratricopeptide (TPR) repeat protein